MCCHRGGAAVNQPGEFKGKIVGPLEFGQPDEGADLKAYGLALATPLKLDDKAECGEQTTSVLAVESASVAAHVGKTVVLRATPCCRVSRSGQYHLGTSPSADADRPRPHDGWRASVATFNQGANNTGDPTRSPA